MLRLIGEPVPWVHPSERESSNPTVFYIKAMTEGQSRKLRALTLTKGELTAEQLNRLMNETFMVCVVRIENVLFPGETVAVTVEDQAGKERFIDCIPVEFMQPIYRAIQNLSDLDEGVRKN